MGDAAIKKTPTILPTGVGVPTRDGWKFTQTWKVPSAATDKSRNDRWERIKIYWLARGSGSFYRDTPFNSTTGESNVRLDPATTSYSITLKAADWYPNSKNILEFVWFALTPWNKKGDTEKFLNEPEYVVKVPAAPSLSISISDETQAASCTISNDDNGTSTTAWRVQTKYRILRQDSSGVVSGDPYIKQKQIYENSYNSASSNNLQFVSTNDPGIQQSLKYGQWCKLTWEAWNLGPAGDSAKKTASHVFAYPPKAVIQRIDLSNVKNPFDATGSVTILLNTNHKDTAPVDRVQLQRLRNSDATTASAAGIESGWTDVSGAVDNRNCKGLSDNAADAIPTTGKHTWYRIKSTHDNLTSYSAPVEATAFYKTAPTAEDDSVRIHSLDGDTEDGTTVIAHLAWPKDDSTGNEVAWSEDPNAWESTDQPNTYKFDWKDSKGQYGLANSGTLYIKGLTPGTPYYIKARRYLDGDGGTTYGKWNPPSSAYWPIVPTSTLAGAELKDVQLYVQQPIIRGKDFSASWTYDSENEQTGWALYAAYNRANIDKPTMIASGSDSIPNTIIKASQIPSNVNDIRFILEMTTGGDWERADSGVWAPVLTPPAALKLPTVTLTKQPLTITVTSLTGLTSFIFVIKSRGASTQRPDGLKIQATGDIIYSGRVTPAYTLRKDGTYVGTITFPNLDFIDGTSYSLETTLVQSTGSTESMYAELKSPTSTSVINVRWAHQASPPNKNSKVTANANSKYVTITPKAPAKATGNDVCDIYRMTPDGAQLIASNIKFGKAVTDKWAPYSKIAPLSYRLATRTTDGDVEFVDIPYKLRGYAIRFDWENKKVLEVPYNLVYGDTYKTDFEERAHLNEKERAGYWNNGYSRSTSVTTEFIRFSNPEQIQLVRELGQYAGAVFVRFPNGCAYMANVEVDSVDENYDSLILDVSFSITQIAMTSEFMV